MNSNNNRIIVKRSSITFRDRPKGKKVFPVTITLTPAQIDYLQKQPNASALIREVLDNLIASEEIDKEKFAAITLNLQLKKLKEKMFALNNERYTFFDENKEHWRRTVNKYPANYIDVVNPDEDYLTWIPKPLDTEDAQVALQVIRGYDKAIGSLREQIAEVKRKILDTE